MSPAKRPSYLKRQKEQKRLARAAEKREARRSRKHSTETEIEDPELQDSELQDAELQDAGQRDSEVQDPGQRDSEIQEPVGMGVVGGEDPRPERPARASRPDPGAVPGVPIGDRPRNRCSRVAAGQSPPTSLRPSCLGDSTFFART